MKYLFSLLCLLLSLTLCAQPLRDINYRYLYNPSESFVLTIKTQREAASGWSLFFKIQLKDTTYQVSDYAIEWELRENLNEKESVTLSPEITELSRSRSTLAGRFELPLTNDGKIIVAKVVQLKLKQAWFFYRTLEPNYPVNTYVSVNNEFRFEPFVSITDKITLSGSDQKIVSYYNDNFPAALPPFAEAQGKVSKGMRTDSTFFIQSGSEIAFSQKGLYLIQTDTNSTQGLSVRVEEDYPRLTRVASLGGPLLYICTKQEYDRLATAKNEKKVFDRVILSMTNDTERARKLIRSYFRRVELANQYFTSYKEGWKTDRGMIYIVFGLPDEVYRFNDREVWTYKNEDIRASFSFIKASSVFDPDNYVLLRDKKYQQTWYEVIDLWRNAGF